MKVLKYIFLTVTFLSVSHAFTQNQLIIETLSPYGYEETIESITLHATEAGWKIPATLNLQKSINGAGYNVLPITVLELCNPHHAAQLMNQDDLKYISSMLPCRISIYMKEDGKTYISRINSDILASEIGGKVEEVMSTAFREIEQIIQELD